MKDLRKFIKDYNPHTLMNKDQMIKLETTALSKLNLGYKCICAKERFHFPILRNTELDTIAMTSCGKSLNNYKTINIPEDIDTQLSCIINSLIKSGVRHVDCPKNGQNICFDEETDTISLIDFDTAYIEGVSDDNKTIKGWSESYGKKDEDYKLAYFKKLKKTINSKAKPIKSRMGLLGALFGETEDNIKGSKGEKSGSKGGKKGKKGKQTTNYEQDSDKKEPSTEPEKTKVKASNKGNSRKNIAINESAKATKTFSFMDPDSLKELNIANRALTIKK